MNEDKKQMAHSVGFGVFSTKEQMETALDEMKREGFRNADISVLFNSNGGTKDFAGGALGSLSGIGVLANPGLGPFIAAGRIMAMLDDSSAGTPIGGLTGALIRMGIPEQVARRYAGCIERGGILLSVHADDSKWIRKARKVFKETGADDIAWADELKNDFASTTRRNASKTVGAASSN